MNHSILYNWYTVFEETLSQFKNNSKQKLKPLSEYYQYCKKQQKIEIENFNVNRRVLRLDKQPPIIAENRSISTAKNEAKILIQDGLKDVYCENSKDWTFQRLSKHYEKPNTICLSNTLGVFYNHTHHDKLTDKNGLKYKGEYRGSKITRVLCSKFQCDRCRPALKTKLKKELAKAVQEHKLLTHIVITTEGKKYRDIYNYIQSYKDMAKNWHKIQGILKYEAKLDGKTFTFICLFRAQKNGYCHLHILTNLCVKKQRLQEITSKYFSTGFIKITKNKDIANYLTNHFLKDHEFFIPYGQRHYSSSRNVKLNIYDDIEEELEDPETSMRIHLQSHRSALDQIYEQIEHEYGYPPPFELMLSEFYETVHKT